MDSTINAIMKTINIVSQMDIPYWKNIIPRIPPLKNLQAFFFKYEISFFIINLIYEKINCIITIYSTCFFNLKKLINLY